ncbi:MAG: hypothetical protein Q7T62_18245 [Undibacterium sp.]|nr:hypothetical protein [Undibacterium sp.]
MKKLYSATEILGMNLPGLPKSKPAFLAKAEKEKWFYETKVGLGGIRKMFQIPAYYQPGYKPYPDEPAQVEPVRRDVAASMAPVTGAIMSGTIVDAKQLALAIRALDEYLQENGLEIKEPEVRAEILAILYKYQQKDATREDIQELLRVMTRKG